MKNEFVVTWLTITNLYFGWLAKTAEQAVANAGAAGLPPLPAETLERIAELYSERVAPLVHQRW